MAKWNKGLVAAMEELEEMENEGAEGGADSLETSMIEANEAGADLDDMDSSIEEAVEGAEEIEAIADTLDETVDEGGADPATARVAEVAVESIFRRLNINRKPMPSMESFGTRSGRVRATELAVEGLKEQAKAIWEKILKAIKSAWEWVKGWYEKLFDAATKLKARADKFAETAKNIKGTAKEKQMDAGGYAAALAFDGKFSSGTAREAVLKAANFVSECDTGLKLTAEAARQFSASDVRAGKELKAKKEPLANLKGDERLAGGKEITLDEGGYFSSRSVKVTEDPKAKKFSGDKIDIAGADEIKAISSAVSGLADKILESKKAQKEAQATLDMVTKFAEKAASMVSDEDKREVSTNNIKVITEFNSLVVSLSKAASGYGITVGKAALDYAEKSLAQYSEGSAKK